ncbi:MAG: transporter [Polyangiaceae bacterium]|nr:transporter [Polyangiaceae bacterium]
MLALLHENALVLLFAVASAGYVVGRVRFFGVSLGVAAVLFVGLGASALDPKLQLPEIVPQLGLTLFVYTVGLASGPGFFASFRKRGLRDAALVLGSLALGAVAAAGLGLALGLPTAVAAGAFAGALTNTPALAGVIHYLREAAAGGAGVSAVAAPVVGYSVAYPGGVIGAIAGILIAERLARGAPEAAAQSVPGAGPRIVTRTVRVTRPAAIGKPAEALVKREGWDVVLGRLRRRGGATMVVDEMTVLEGDDLVTVVGPEKEVVKAIAALGERSEEALELDRSVVDYRRVFVTNPKVIGRSLRALDLSRRFGATVTRVRRGDAEMLAEEDMVLEAGDRVRVVAPRERLEEVSAFFGDSYKAIAEVDVLTFGLGVAIGIALGEIPLPLPGGVTFRLGAAGGPLIAGLVLGRLGRTGPLRWSMPFSANLTLRQLGLVLFLAGVGTRSGSTFAATLAQGGALPLVAAGAAITSVVALAIVLMGRRLKVPAAVLGGMIAGIHTQPAALQFACERTTNEAPNVGYAAVFPLATIAKIVLAQLLVMTLGSGGPGP